MAKLYTRKGDSGETGLRGGPRVRKDHPRVEAYGSVDELNAHVGVAADIVRRSHGNSPLASLLTRLEQIQNQLFAVGAELASPKATAGGAGIDEQVREAESWIDEADSNLPALSAFVLPAGDALACQFHVCRTVCRRAERCVVALAGSETVDGQLVAYLNRLSDLFFAWARLANHVAGVGDVPWDGGAG